MWLSKGGVAFTGAGFPEEGGAGAAGSGQGRFAASELVPVPRLGTVHGPALSGTLKCINSGMYMPGGRPLKSSVAFAGEGDAGAMYDETRGLPTP